MVTCNNTPIKYLESKFSILLKEIASFLPCLTGKKLIILVKIKPPSFNKKKEINKTDNIPRLKLPI